MNRTGPIVALCAAAALLTAPFTLAEDKLVKGETRIDVPAIGEGLGATLIYFHAEDESEHPRVATDQEIRYLIVS